MSTTAERSNGNDSIYSSAGQRGNSRAPALSIDVSQKSRLSTAELRAQAQAARAQEEDSEDDSSQLHVHNGDGEEEEEDMDDAGSFSDSLSSSPSVPEEDIDFSLVYSLHTFLATVDGQASVVKGDKLSLLDDSNSYWWLVRVLKTQMVGYIPAENIETPYERLARLNKHRNVGLSSANDEDHITGPNSTIAQTRFETRIPPSRQPHPHRSQHPSSKGVLADPSHKDHPRNISPVDDRPDSRKGKTVIFTAPTYYEHSANGESDDYGEEDENGEMMGEQVFEDENDEESEFSDDNLTEDGVSHEDLRGAHVRRGSVAQELHTEDAGNDASDEEDMTTSQWEEERAQSVQAQKAQAEAQWRAQQGQHRSLSPQQQQSLELQQQQQAQQRIIDSNAHDSVEQRALSPQYQKNQLQHQHQQQQLIQQQHQQRAMSVSGQYSNNSANVNLERQTSDPYSRRTEPSRSLRTLPELEDDEYNQDAPTKKLSATPPIVRDLTFDINNPYGELPNGARAPSPMRVRGVEVVDPKDPRYGKLITERRPDQQLMRPNEGSYGIENENPIISTNSLDAASSFPSGSDDSHPRSPVSVLAPSNGSALSKKGSRESIDGSEKKRKGSGIMSLFRKKDKKKKSDKDEDGRSSEETARSPVGSRSSNGGSLDLSNQTTPDRSSKRISQTAESMFSTESALRQQQVEAKQALFHQYGVQRGPGDVTNTMTPRAPLQRVNSLTPASAQGTPQRMRPGSLIGSPSIPGLDVPLLSVLRVFSGENIESEATFKTVLLNRLTSSTDLVKQSMQRFRLAGLEEQGEYYLTVRELGGEERLLTEDEKPLVTFEALSDHPDGFTVPSVKRSSVGSISSITSNLSLNPAITRLGMNDFSDDSAVKFYLNRRSLAPPLMEPSLSTSSEQHLAPEPFSPTPSFRFAIRLILRPADLPDHVGFDPATNAVVSKHILLERQQRSGIEGPLEVSDPRERIIFFPKNVSVSEVVEAGLDRFGIVDGIVDGGDEVESRVLQRPTVSLVKYGLAVEQNGRDTPLGLSSKLLDVYRSAPIFKPYDRTSKEFRRRSVDATLILGSNEDVQPHDPVFFLRRAANFGVNSESSPGPIPIVIDELAAHRQQQAQRTVEPVILAPPRPNRMNTTDSFGGPPSVYATPMEEIVTPFDDAFASTTVKAQSQPSRHDIITAQREATRASQRAIVSAEKNAEQGVDIVLPDRSTVRSSRNFTDGGVSYSFIDRDGDTTDISEMIETEWLMDANAVEELAPTQSHVDGPIQGEPFLGAVSSTKAVPSNDDRTATAQVRSNAVDVSADESRKPLLQQTTSLSSDVFEVALQPSATSPTTTETLQERLDRVLARVKDEKARGISGRRSPDSRPGSRTARALISGNNTPSGRLSPSTRASGRLSPEGRRSPLREGRDSPSIDQLIRSPMTPPLIQTLRHGQQGSIASLSSNQSGTTNSTNPSSPRTHASTAATVFSASPPVRGDSRVIQRSPVIYRPDFGLETLMTIVDDGSRTRSIRKKLDVGVDHLFGQSLDHESLHPAIRSWYVESSKTYSDLDQRLDALLRQVIES